MNKFEPYLLAIARISRRTGITLSAKPGINYLEIEGERFALSNAVKIMNPDSRDKAILVRDINKESIAHCLDRRISFLSSKGDLYLAKKQFRITLEDRRRRGRERHGAQPKAMHSVPPTLLVSPNGLAILDALFSLNDMDLQKFKSALSFIRPNGLNQSKLSHMMTRFRTRSLLDLKQKIRDLPLSWWETALRYPMTKKRLTPFFEIAQPFHLVDETPLGIVTARSGFKRINELQNSSFVSGPVEVVKDLGLIRTSDFYLWMTKQNALELKRSLKLIPGASRVSSTWYISVPPRGLELETIVSNRFALNQSAKAKPNRFRAIWDLSFGDERMREIQTEALRQILNEN